MKCTRCKAKAEVHLRAHNAGFCRPCYLMFFQRQVERAVKHEKMFTVGERLLVCISGGKDSLALWDVLVELGHDTTGFYLAQGIGSYSDHSREKVEAFATTRGLPLVVTDLSSEGTGLEIPAVAKLTRRSACSACGTFKRHYFDRAAIEGGFEVLVTGHNLDDEAARLFGNVLRWQTDHLARQRPVLPPTHEKFVRKVKPLFLLSEYETAVYAFMRGIDYVVEECPNAVGATQLTYKDALNRLEHASPGTKMAFVREFLRTGQPLIAAGVAAGATPADGPPGACERCGMPAWGSICGFCRLVSEVETRRARQTPAPIA
jgi:tRNA-5-methyluridine54 2-sulfurtransferase